MNTKLSLLLGLGSIFSGLSSQILPITSTEEKPCKFTLGVFTGLAFGVTDMGRGTPGLALGLAAEKRFESGLMVSGKFNSAYFSGRTSEVYYSGEYDPWTTPPESRKNYRAEVDVLDMSLNLGYNISKLYAYRPRLSVVISGGVGLAHYNSKVTYISDREAGTPSQSDQIENVLIMPIGLDLHYRISPRLKLGIAAHYNFTTTDRMDQVAPLTDYSKDNYGTIGLVLKYKVL